MSKTVRDALFFGAMGLFLGALPALLAAGVYATWRLGGALTEIDFMTIVHLAQAYGVTTEPVKTAVLIGAGVFVGAAIAAMVLGYARPLSSHGTARWAENAELRKLKLLAAPREVIGPIYAKLGTPASHAPYVSTKEIPHSLIVGPTGAGKGAGPITSTLLTYNGSIVCNDVKGENYRNTARRRAAMGDLVHKFAPYDPERRTHRYNRLDYLVNAPPDWRYTEALRIAASFIAAKSEGGEGFIEGARDIFVATALLAVEISVARAETAPYDPPAPPTIGGVFDLLSQEGQPSEILRRFSRTVKSPEARKIFNHVSSLDPKILGSYLSILKEGGLKLWNDPAVRYATSASDFSIYDLRRRPTTIYLIIPPNDIEPLAPLVRLLFQQIIAVLQRSEPGPDEPFPVLFLLDEFASLGRMEVLRSAINTLRGYGGRVMLIVQALANLREHYGVSGASNFLINCKVQMFMAPGDNDTPDYISRAIGDRTQKLRTKSWDPAAW